MNFSAVSRSYATTLAPARSTSPRSDSRASDDGAPQHPAILRRLALRDIPSGDGLAAVPIVWLYLASCLTWGGDARDVWPTNRKIAEDTGLSVRSIQYALGLLEQAGKVTSRMGWKRVGKSKTSKRLRILTLEIGHGPNPKVLWPDAGHVRGLWELARKDGRRRTSLVALAIAAYVWASVRGRPTRTKTIHPPLVVLRELTGAAHGSTFNRRLAELEAAGIFGRAGEHWRHGIVLRLDLLTRSMEAEVDRVRPSTMFPRLVPDPEPFADVPPLDDTEADALAWGVDPPGD